MPGHSVFSFPPAGWLIRQKLDVAAPTPRERARRNQEGEAYAKIRLVRLL